MWNDAMALGQGSKKSISCDQGVTPASLNNAVSNANTEVHLLSELYQSVYSDQCVKPVDLLE